MCKHKLISPRINGVNEAGNPRDLKIECEKTKVMHVGNTCVEFLRIAEEDLGNVDMFK